MPGRAEVLEVLAEYWAETLCWQGGELSCVPLSLVPAGRELLSIPELPGGFLNPAGRSFLQDAARPGRGRKFPLDQEEKLSITRPVKNRRRANKGMGRSAL